MHGNRNPCNSFLMVKMASGMDHRRVRPTTTTNDDVAQHGGHPANTRSCSLGLKHMSLILNIHMMFNWQLSYQDICWPVSRDHIASSGLELITVVCFFKFTADWSLLLTKCWFSIGSRAHVMLTCWKQSRIARKPVNANPDLTFSSIQMLFAALFCLYGDRKNSKQEAKQYTANLTAKLQNSNQNSTFSWVSLIGLWTTWPSSYAFRLA